MRTFAFGFALLFLPAVGHAAWSVNGNPVCTAPNMQSQQSLAPDGAGGFYVAWNDARAGSDIYLTRVLGDGTIATGWPANGLRISSSGTVSNPVVVPDGAGGALVFWRRENFYNYQVRYQRVDANAATLFAAGGALLYDFFTALGPAYGVASDGAGGAYVAFTRSASNQTATLTRIDHSGGFVAPFDSTGTALHTQMIIDSIELSADPSGGVVWAVNSIYDGPFVHDYVDVGRVTETGPAFAVGLGNGDDSDCKAIADGQGGLFARWFRQNRYDPSDFGNRLQKVDAAGGTLWPNPGATTAGELAVLLRDGAGGVFEMVADYFAPAHLEVRRRLPDGTIAPGWPVVLAQDQATSPQPGGVSTTAGFIACWAQKGTDFDLRAAGYMTNGALAPGWPAGGVPVTALSGDQNNAVLLATPTEGVFVVWQDARPGSAGGDLYAMRVEPDRVVGTPPRIDPQAIAFRAIAPNPARDLVRVDLALAGEAPTTLELIDLRGRVLARRNATPSTTIATQGLPAGLYWLRATQNGSVARARIAVVH